MKSKIELKNEILNVKSAEEYQKLARENGAEISLEEAEEAFEKLKAALTPEGKLLDNDELALIGGGNGRDDCKATVESSSWCWSGDNCVMAVNIYETPNFCQSPAGGTHNPADQCLKP